MKQPQVVEIECSPETMSSQNQLSTKRRTALHRTEALRITNTESIRQAFGSGDEVWIVRYVARLPSRLSPWRARNGSMASFTIS